jgi:hypothetical protein
MVEWNFCSHFKEKSFCLIHRMEKVAFCLSELNDHYSLSLLLEPHLLLIKSQSLNQLYTDLKYNKGMYREYLPVLINESKRDYRLEALLQKFSVAVWKQHESVKKTL